MLDQSIDLVRQVLVVDDDPMNLALVKLRIAKLGLNITSAQDGSEAVDWVKIKKFDLILMDIQMPRLDGVQATRLIRQLPYGVDVPILATTGNPSEQQCANYLEAGMNGFIAKPFIASELLDAVLTWINPP